MLLDANFSRLLCYQRKFPSFGEIARMFIALGVSGFGTPGMESKAFTRYVSLQGRRKKKTNDALK